MSDRTILEHVERLLEESALTIAAVHTRVSLAKRLPPAEREELRRRLAGVVSAVETTRLWLDAGAPR